MLKLNLQQQPLAVSYPRPTDPGTARRLIVLVPNPDIDPSALTQRVWNLAEDMGAHIKFVGLCHESSQELSFRRTLAAMSAMMNYDKVSADTEILFGKDWLRTLKSQLQQGDMIVCWKDQDAGLLKNPLSQMLRSDLDTPLYIMSGLRSKSNVQPWITQVIAWSGFLVIVGGFLGLQIKLYQHITGWTMPLMVLSTAIEFWLIWAWNSNHG